jgi:glycosyltransferase involved in cell wall biosynthesis
MPHLLNTIGKLDVNIVNVSEYVSPPTWLLSILKGKWKTVLTQHGYGKRQTARDQIYEYLTRKFLIARIDGFVGIGLRARQLLERLGARGVAVIPNPIDDTLFRYILPYHKREDLVLYVGKADTRRGLHLVLKAMENVRQKIEKAKLLIIGEEGNLSEQIRGRSWVRYLGPKPHLEMARYYNLAKVFVSAVPGEAGCGCALEEALACGTPVVGTTHLDFPFVWRDEEVGYMVNPDQTSLAEGIIKILQDGTRLHDRCRETAIREFGHLSVGRRYSKVFERVLNR